MELVRQLADKLVPRLRFTKDIPSYHTNEKCPMLDVQVWLEDRGDHKVIRHTFYQKDTTSPLVFHSRGPTPGGVR